MNLRLSTLLRQRDLLREHLHWLEEEIASAGASPEQQRSPTPIPPTTTTLPSISAATNATALATAGAGAGASASPSASARSLENAAANATPIADDILPELDAKGIHDEVRRGCLIYATIAFACIAVIMALAFWKR